MREHLKTAVLKRLWGRKLYGTFRRARTVYLLARLYTGWISSERLLEIAEKKHIEPKELISALDRIRSRSNMARNLRVVKALKKNNE